LRPGGPPGLQARSPQPRPIPVAGQLGGIGATPALGMEHLPGDGDRASAGFRSKIYILLQ